MNDELHEPQVAWIGLGANLGDPPAQMREAVARIRSWPELGAWTASSLYVGPYVGSAAEQPDYHNAVLRIDVGLDAHDCLRRLHAIQHAIEGVPHAHQAARLLDLDLLLFAAESHDSVELSLPHPRLRERRFVLEPMFELEPDLRLPPDAQPLGGLLSEAHVRAQELIRVSGPSQWLAMERACTT